MGYMEPADLGDEDSEEDEEGSSLLEEDLTPDEVGDADMKRGREARLELEESSEKGHVDALTSGEQEEADEEAEDDDEE